ncbi:cupin [Bacterioplanes sanyensis]|uniref:Cupin n=1 Tax=Bacterioplanes sanyensis TaxID=1249553 RepID=A0A222FG35_9GAMM|nr:cupin domain-containing protein [Bacterioplanes sanyensis]ASP37958.1 cupin [Bacterioplanes sanyensis]
MTFQPLRMDRAQSAIVRPGEQQWLRAPQAPIERWPLEREAPEHGQVTSLVRYLAAAQFPPHRHPQGEEILVLQGTFSDEGGDFPAGSYLRNPPGSQHAPFSTDGCLIFVKLNQFAVGDDQWVRQQDQGSAQQLLHQFASEQTWLLTLPGDLPDAHLFQRAELLVITGDVSLGGQSCPALSWLRLSVDQLQQITATAVTRVLLKLTGECATSAAEQS